MVLNPDYTWRWFQKGHYVTTHLVEISRLCNLWLCWHSQNDKTHPNGLELDSYDIGVADLIHQYYVFLGRWNSYHCHCKPYLFYVDPPQFIDPQAIGDRTSDTAHSLATSQNGLQACSHHMWWNLCCTLWMIVTLLIVSLIWKGTKCVSLLLLAYTSSYLYLVYYRSHDIQERFRWRYCERH